jgi:ubiquinone/menaquinone biosynthesis C-methylase UbiE
MQKITDQRYLVTSQYKNVENLKKRSDLHERFSTSQINWHTWVFNHLDIPPQAEILEIGCGAGKLWESNRERIPENWNFVFGDLSHGMLKEAQKNLAFLGSRARFQVLDAQLLYFDSESFDIILANHMLYHVQNVTRAIQEFERILKPDGVFYAATNGTDHMRALKLLVSSMSDINQFLPNDAIIFNLEYSFNLENGADILSKYFSDVALHTFDDALDITEIEPVVEYVLSLEPDLDQETRTGVYDILRKNLTRAMDSAGGVLRISKSIGMFECRK